MKRRLYNIMTINPFVSINGEEVCVKSLIDRTVTLEEYKAVRANLEGFRILHSKLDNEAIAYAVEIYLKNARNDHPITYDGALKYELIPELLTRLHDLDQEAKLLKDEYYCSKKEQSINMETQKRQSTNITKKIMEFIEEDTVE